MVRRFAILLALLLVASCSLALAASVPAPQINLPQPQIPTPQLPQPKITVPQPQVPTPNLPGSAVSPSMASDSSAEDAASNDSEGSITFEGTPYHLTYEGAEIVDGALNIRISGFGNTLPFRNGSVVIIAWAAAGFEDGEARADSVNAGGDGTYTFIFDRAELPRAVIVYPHEDKDHPVTLWRDPSA